MLKKDGYREEGELEFRILCVVVSAIVAITISALAAMVVASAIKVAPALADDAKQASGDYTATAWSEDDAPDYYRIAGRAIIEHPEVPKDNRIHYGGLDSLGRATWAAGFITRELWERESAEPFDTSPLPETPGWDGNGKAVIEGADGSPEYKGYVYSKGHLIPGCLGGERVPENYVTATQNMIVGNNDGDGGMEHVEAEVWGIMANDPKGYFFYEAIPVYVGDELIPRSVFVDVQSRDGKVDERVEAYNVKKGIAIDYSTGAWVEGDPNATRLYDGEAVYANSGVEGAAGDQAPSQETGTPADSIRAHLTFWACATGVLLLAALVGAWVSERTEEDGERKGARVEAGPSGGGVHGG